MLPSNIIRSVYGARLWQFATSSRKGTAVLKSYLPGKNEKDLNAEYDTPGVPREIPTSSTFPAGWRPSQERQKIGFAVPSKFHIELPQQLGTDKQKNVTYSRDTSSQVNYSDFCGLRFPTLDTSRNKNYWKDIGLNRILPRVFPIKLPTSRKVDPLMRKYIYFLHTFDPARFTIPRIALRYGFKSSTIEAIIRQCSLHSFIRRYKLCNIRNKRISLQEARLQIKEEAYRDNIGYIFTGDETGKSDSFTGNKDAHDWVELQAVKVESLQAFPLPSTRDPMPKRVHVDLVVANSRHHKIINWIDPSEKIVF